MAQKSGGRAAQGANNPDEQKKKIKRTGGGPQRIPRKRSKSPHFCGFEKREKATIAVKAGVHRDNLFLGNCLMTQRDKYEGGESCAAVLNI